MNTLPPNESEIVTINAGGEIIWANRDTLCLVPGTLFAALFSGRWEDRLNKDAEGRVYLEYDGLFIRLIVNYLRFKQIEDPSDPIPPPYVAEDRNKEWICLLKHLGFDTFFYPPPKRNTWVSKLSVVQKVGPRVSSSKVDGGLELVWNGPINNSFGVAVTCTPCVPEAKAAWKVTINKLESGGYVFLGVCKDNAGGTFGWGSSGFVFVGEHWTNNTSDWTGFTEGECLHFLLEDGKLTMISLLKKKRFVLQPIPTVDIALRFAFDPSAPAKISLAALDEDELAKSSLYN